jgi:Cdc6-like AAA superfamily ATPase
VNDVLDQLALAVQTLQLGLSSSSHSQLINVAHQVDEVTAQLSSLKQDLLEWRQDDQYLKIMSWLDAPDQTPYHAAACQKHEPGTGQWLLESATYKTWKTSSGSHLWLHGKAGCGKTVVCSSLIEDLKSSCASTKDSVLAFFYFSFSDNNSQSYRKLLASLVHQLCLNQPSYEKLKESFDGTKQASVSVLDTVLNSQIGQHGTVMFVLDALDELPDGDDRSLVLAKLKAFNNRGTNIKALTISRSSADIEEAMTGMKALVLPLTAQEVNADIGRYIVSEFSQTPSLLRWSPKMQLRARQMLEEKADGM